ncbi:type I restriction endonuclease subunit R [Epilithonimonas sp.]|uniref:type I restriction endonuclease subunit R n=1 Tax=Epilithonimonas sp. TaxID=2894511 RepID=UPI002899D53D|nr:type I restriction endonuclease subunit R [Epilithonimonas sp.]
MRNFLSEDDIEIAVVRELQKQSDKWRFLNCYTADATNLQDGSNRLDKSEVVFKDILKEKLIQLNSYVPLIAIHQAIDKLTTGKRAMSSIKANIEVYNMLKSGISVRYDDSDGKEVREKLKVIDFNNTDQNDFLVVTQLWIKGDLGFRRPDLILYINGLPLVLIELKNSNVSVENAYLDNLTNYKNELPQLFWYNAIAVLSNAKETRIGSFTAPWEHFASWLRIEDEKERPDRESIAKKGISLKYIVEGLFQRDKLLDYIENFIMFYNSDYKICAKNHQFIGVNKAIESFSHREEKHGKLGVFWHTQGSGKSYSMVFFTRKVFRKFEGDYTFLVITDRTDLDTQIYRNFVNMGASKEADTVLPNNSEELRELLKTNKKYIFTVIHKFRFDKGKQYPIISERDDIIVIVDEAHRTQYASLAENMRVGLPNAQFIAFTGTPLLGKEKKTNAWFGDYISEYNFAQAIDDGATVPLFYDKRLPEVLIANDDLNEELATILEEENLDEQQQQKLENKFSKELEVIKRDDRLETIAKDIAYHFPRRGYLGKGMVICVDKFTAVNMYDKVNKYVKEQLKQLRKELKEVDSAKIKEELKSIIHYLNKLEMAVVISEDANENELFEARGLNIQYHRKKLNSLDKNQESIEDNFKDENHPLQLVFVCAMWLTGFDAPTVSTLYLDKPMQNHTLMQTIARANRVASPINGVEKKNGLIIDYYNVFRNIKKALADYGNGEEADTKQNPEDEDPVQDFAQLYVLLNETIETCISFCNNLGINLNEIVQSEETFSKLELFNSYADILLGNDNLRKEFNVYDNTAYGLYEACRPNILQFKDRYKIVEVIHYLRGVCDSHIGEANIANAENRITELLDQSVLATDEAKENLSQNFNYKSSIQGYKKELNLATLNFDKLREEFATKKYKNIEISDLKAFLESKLLQMLSENTTRISFLEKFQAIVDRYNSGGRLTEDYYSELLEIAGELNQEGLRAKREGLTEAEQEIFDLILKDTLTKKEKQQVKLAAKNLLMRLKEEKPVVLIQDWFRDTQSQIKVKSAIEMVLDSLLPESYNRTDFSSVSDKVYNHILVQASMGYGWISA